MIWLNMVSKFIKAFRSGESPGQIGAGFSVGFMIGLMPFWTLQGIVLFVLLFLLNINMAAGTLAILLSSFFAYLLDPIFHNLGFFVLTGIPVLQNLWETIYNIPIGPLTRFNNTVVMGSFVSGLILFIPVFFGMKKLVVLYRENFEAKVKQFKVVQAIKGSKLVRLYDRIRDLGGEL
ncbi:TIGR03546 family protein [candidate division KSB1 bacterium]|nr:TIGR03546 family protein [candidate division KSB1 bacterium]